MNGNVRGERHEEDRSETGGGRMGDVGVRGIERETR